MTINMGVGDVCHVVVEVTSAYPLATPTLIDFVRRRLAPDLLTRREAAVSLMLGWLGLRAWWCYDPRAAKFNLWLLPMRPLMAVVMTGIQVTTEMSYGRHPEWGVYLLLGLLLWVLPWMYCSKVREPCWKKLLDT